MTENDFELRLIDALQSSLSFFPRKLQMTDAVILSRGHLGKKTVKVLRAVVQPAVPVSNSPSLLLGVFRRLRLSSFIVASSEGKRPRALAILQSWKLVDLMVILIRQCDHSCALSLCDLDGVGDAAVHQALSGCWGVVKSAPVDLQGGAA